MTYEKLNDLLDSIIMNKMIMDMSQKGFEDAIQELDRITSGHFNQGTIEKELESIKFDAILNDKLNKARSIFEQI